ncbi:large ribosomal subunit protein P2-like [Oscarella lobularis]|uniref:large ribosomal subunit protein P2-like n=1 Tax=Oscarella lobularis TaxID=121494 RepID=UPI0033133C23
MRYVAAYRLASLANKGEPTADDIKKILGSVGIDANEERLAKVVDELKGKNIEDVIAEGQSKLASVPTGGVAVAASGGTTTDGGATEEKKEEKVEEEEEEESDEDMGFGDF